MNTLDPNYRRLKYVRYADDFLLGFIGPKSEAEEIKRKLEAFLREQLKLELSQTKTLITHARTERARFLGYEIQVLLLEGQVELVLVQESGLAVGRQLLVDEGVAGQPMDPQEDDR